MGWEVFKLWSSSRCAGFINFVALSGVQKRHFSGGVGLSAQTGICDCGSGCGGGKSAGIVSMVGENDEEVARDVTDCHHGGV